MSTVSRDLAVRIGTARSLSLAVRNRTVRTDDFMTEFHARRIRPVRTGEITPSTPVTGRPGQQTHVTPVHVKSLKPTRTLKLLLLGEQNMDSLEGFHGTISF